MVRVREGNGERIEKHRRGILEGHAVLLEIRRRFSDVPLKRHETKLGPPATLPYSNNCRSSAPRAR